MSSTNRKETLSAPDEYVKKQTMLQNALQTQSNLPKSNTAVPAATVASATSASSASLQSNSSPSSTKQQTSAPKASEVSYVDPYGATQRGYIINGTTYTDPNGSNPVPVGSTVTDSQGRKWYKGANGSYQVTATSETPGQAYSDLSPLINQSYDKGDQLIRDTVAQQTQKSVDQLNRALQDAQPNYEAAIANQLLESKQAQDAKAYRNQMNGDRGGIGSAQVDSIGNTGAANREAIAQQQRQLATDTARQIADLRAQGKFEEASQLLQNNQARLSALYNEQVRLQSAEQGRLETLAALGKTYLSNGIMPNNEMLSAMGIDTATAKQYIDLLNGVANSNGNASGEIKVDNGSIVGKGGNTVDLTPYVDLTGHASLSANAYELFQNMSSSSKSKDAWKQTILENMANGSISLDDGMYLAKQIGASRTSLVSYIEEQMNAGTITEDMADSWLRGLGFK